MSLSTYPSRSSWIPRRDSNSDHWKSRRKSNHSKPPLSYFPLTLRSVKSRNSYRSLRTEDEGFSEQFSATADTQRDSEDNDITRPNPSFFNDVDAVTISGTSFADFPAANIRHHGYLSVLTDKTSILSLHKTWKLRYFVLESETLPAIMYMFKSSVEFISFTSSSCAPVPLSHFTITAQTTIMTEEHANHSWTFVMSKPGHKSWTLQTEGKIEMMQWIHHIQYMVGKAGFAERHSPASPLLDSPTAYESDPSTSSTTPQSASTASESWSPISTLSLPVLSPKPLLQPASSAPAFLAADSDIHTTHSGSTSVSPLAYRPSPKSSTSSQEHYFRSRTASNGSPFFVHLPEHPLPLPAEPPLLPGEVFSDGDNLFSEDGMNFDPPVGLGIAMVDEVHPNMLRNVSHQLSSAFSSKNSSFSLKCSNGSHSTYIPSPLSPRCSAPTSPLLTDRPPPIETNYKPTRVLGSQMNFSTSPTEINDMMDLKRSDKEMERKDLEHENTAEEEGEEGEEEGEETSTIRQGRIEKFGQIFGLLFSSRSSHQRSASSFSIRKGDENPIMGFPSDSLPTPPASTCTLPTAMHSGKLASFARKIRGKKNRTEIDSGMEDEQAGRTVM